MGNDFNRGTDIGAKILESSLRRLGCCRSVVVDRDGEVLVGAKVLSKCRELGIPIIEVESDGSSLVVVRRTDVSASTKKGVEISFVDNLSSERGLDWDNENILHAMNTYFGFDPRSYGVEMSLDKDFNVEDFFDELKKKPVKKDVELFTQTTIFDDL